MKFYNEVIELGNRALPARQAATELWRVITILRNGFIPHIRYFSVNQSSGAPKDIPIPSSLSEIMNNMDSLVDQKYKWSNRADGSIDIDSEFSPPGWHFLIIDQKLDASAAGCRINWESRAPHSSSISLYWKMPTDLVAAKSIRENLSITLAAYGWSISG